MTRRIIKVIFRAVLAASFFSAITCLWLLWPRYEQYAVFPSPDGKYKIVMIGRYNLLPGMPGQGGDVPGVAQLYDARGVKLREAKVGMVQLGNDVEWSQDVVELPLVFKWSLPQAEETDAAKKRNKPSVSR